jgi:hypothetical protein
MFSQKHGLCHEFTTRRDSLMGVSKKKVEKSPAELQLEALEYLVGAYQNVISDFMLDIGWPKRLQKKVIAALEQREYELDHIWRELYEAELDAEEEFNRK